MKFSKWCVNGNESHVTQYKHIHFQIRNAEDKLKTVKEVFMQPRFLVMNAP